MALIKQQKLLYHLTSLRNVGSILDGGLKPRADLHTFHDVADANILVGRRKYQLQTCVPFHWFANNPFAGRVQKDSPSELFVLITVRREHAERNNWKILPQHPLTGPDASPYDYREGFDKIDWTLMQKRNYHESDCKSACMAECLSPAAVSSSKFYIVFVPDVAVFNAVNDEAVSRGLRLNLHINPRMFC